MRDAVGIFQFGVAGKPVQHERQSLVALHVAGAFEEFIEHSTDQVFGRGDKASRTRLVRKLTVDQAVVVGKVDIHFDIQRRARW